MSEEQPGPQMNPKHSDHISKVRQHAQAAVGALLQAIADAQEYQLLDYANQITDVDFGGANSDMTAADLTALMGTLNAFVSLAQANNAAHMRNLLLAAR